MAKLNYDTVRLKCRPLTIRDNTSLLEIVNDPVTQRFFRIGNSLGEVTEYILGITQYDALQVGLTLKSTKQLIGVICGYDRGGCELQVEFYLDALYRRQKYMLEALSSYIDFAKLEGFLTFRFEVEPENLASISLLSCFGARHFSDEDFTDNGRNFKVYRVCF